MWIDFNLDHNYLRKKEKKKKKEKGKSEIMHWILAVATRRCVHCQQQM